MCQGQAGTIESNDIMITVARAERGHGIVVDLMSTVMHQYGEHIRELMTEAIRQRGFQDVHVSANDRGALDCTIKARVITAMMRLEALEEKQEAGGKEDVVCRNCAEV